MIRENPWCEIKPGDYDAHMSHPNVGQTQMLNRIIKEQFELVPTDRRAASSVAILGITNGNGLEHVIPCGIGQVIGIDINNRFLDECRSRFLNLEKRLSLYQMDLAVNAECTAKVLASSSLVIANLLIEHVHLENFTKIIRLLPKHGQIISCVIQRNPDGSIASASGIERVFDAVVKQVEEENESALSLTMENNGYLLSNRMIYDLPNGKQFVRLDYVAA